MFNYFKSFFFGQSASVPQQLNKDNPSMNISPRLLQRYISFMRDEIDVMSVMHSLMGVAIDQAKGLNNNPSVVEFFYEKKKGYKNKENRIAFIQGHVKRALAHSTAISPSLAQAMEKQVTMLLHNACANKLSVKADKHLFETKADYLKHLNAAKNIEARLVELQQAIRKAKQ